MATQFQKLIDNEICKTHHEKICEEMTQAVSECEYPVGMVELDGLSFDVSDYTKPVAAVTVTSTWSASHHKEDFDFNGSVSVDVKLTLRGTHTDIEIGQSSVDVDMGD